MSHRKLNGGEKVFNCETAITKITHIRIFCLFFFLFFSILLFSIFETSEKPFVYYHSSRVIAVCLLPVSVCISRMRRSSPGSSASLLIHGLCLTFSLSLFPFISLALSTECHPPLLLLQPLQECTPLNTITSAQNYLRCDQGLESAQCLTRNIGN